MKTNGFFELIGAVDPTDTTSPSPLMDTISPILSPATESVMSSPFFSHAFTRKSNLYTLTTPANAAPEKVLNKGAPIATVRPSVERSTAVPKYVASGPVNS